MVINDRDRKLLDKLSGSIIWVVNPDSFSGPSPTTAVITGIIPDDGFVSYKLSNKQVLTADEIFFSKQECQCHIASKKV